MKQPLTSNHWTWKKEDGGLIFRNRSKSSTEYGCHHSSAAVSEPVLSPLAFMQSTGRDSVFQISLSCKEQHWLSYPLMYPKCWEHKEFPQFPLEIIQRESLTLIFKVVRSCSIRWPLIAHLFVRSFWKRVM